MSNSQKFRLSPFILNLSVIIYVLGAFNSRFWSEARELFGTYPLRMILFVSAIFGLSLFLVSLGAFRWLHKPWLIFLVLVGAASSFYLNSMSVFVDREMIQNIVMTNMGESLELLTPSLLWHMVKFGAVPAIIIALVPLQRLSLPRYLLVWVGGSAAGVLLTFGPILADMQGFASAFRANRTLMASYLPGAPVNAAIRYAVMLYEGRELEFVTVGRDAQPGGAFADDARPRLVVVAIGETARAQNWGLNGYVRNTTPELAQHDVVNFRDMSSCGTSTAVSVPCLFAQVPRRDYSLTYHRSHENLLDVAAHAGFEVRWWENNGGDYGVATRIDVQRMSEADDAVACNGGGGCTDQVFVDALARFIETMERDTFLVLHMIGSHGPAYYLRYPEERAVFTPACSSPDFQTCTQEEIVNAYDNTIAFTDHVLAQLINVLEQSDHIVPSLLYVSDHGESLGEAGMYLHGAPFFIAPEEQTRVPMIMWFSSDMRAGLRLDTDCLSQVAIQPASHDNLFATFLAMMDITTTARDPALDLLANCEIPQ